MGSFDNASEMGSCQYASMLCEELIYCPFSAGTGQQDMYNYSSGTSSLTKYPSSTSTTPLTPGITAGGASTAAAPATNRRTSPAAQTWNQQYRTGQVRMHSRIF